MFLRRVYLHSCANGHFHDGGQTLISMRFCELCGAEMLNKCPSCDNFIREDSYYVMDLDDGIPYKDDRQYFKDLPSYCGYCGEPFPWTVSALETAEAIIRETKELSAEEQDNLITSLPEIINETPKTKLAALRFKNALSKAGTFTADALRQFAIDFACEVVKKQMGL